MFLLSQNKEEDNMSEKSLQKERNRRGHWLDTWKKHYTINYTKSQVHFGKASRTSNKHS